MTYNLTLNIQNILEKSPAKAEKNIANLISFFDNEEILDILLNLKKEEINIKIKDAIQKIVIPQTYDYFLKNKITINNLNLIEKIYAELSALRQIKIKNKIKQDLKKEPDFLQKEEKTFSREVIIYRDLKQDKFESLINYIELKKTFPINFINRIFRIYKERKDNIEGHHLDVFVRFLNKIPSENINTFMDIILLKTTNEDFIKFFNNIDYFKNKKNSEGLGVFFKVMSNYGLLVEHCENKNFINIVKNLNSHYLNFSYIKENEILKKQELPFSFILNDLNSFVENLPEDQKEKIDFNIQREIKELYNYHPSVMKKIQKISLMIDLEKSVPQKADNKKAHKI